MSYESEAELPIKDQARVEARAAHKVYMTVLVLKEATGRPFPGLLLANALFNAVDRGLDQSFDVALGASPAFASARSQHPRPQRSASSMR